MPENQEDIDALLAEVSDLAEEAVADLGGDEPEEAAASEPAPSPATPESPPSQSRQKTPAPSPPSAAPAEDGSPLPFASFDDNIQRILNLEVPVIVQLAENTMSMAEVRSLASGSIIEFEKSADSELDLLINNECIGQGQAVKVGENFGLRITKVGSVKERIKAMGQK